MEPYIQRIPALQLAIERSTSRVPNDGYFYVLLAGDIRGRHRTLKQAKSQYDELLKQLGWRPEPQKASNDPGAEAVQRYMDSLEAYWADAHNHRRRGGKTMYRS